MSKIFVGTVQLTVKQALKFFYLPFCVRQELKAGNQADFDYYLKDHK